VNDDKNKISVNNVLFRNIKEWEVDQSFVGVNSSMDESRNISRTNSRSESLSGIKDIRKSNMTNTTYKLRETNLSDFNNRISIMQTNATNNTGQMAKSALSLKAGVICHAEQKFRKIMEIDGMDPREL